MKLLIHILVLLIAARSSAQTYDISQAKTLKNLGQLAKEIFLERNANEATYSDFNLQLKTNEDEGYIGRDKEPSITPQILITEIDLFLNFAEANSKIIAKDDALLIDTLHKLTGASIALKSIYTIASDTNTVQMIQRRLYNRSCFGYGSFANAKIKDPISFIWMSECYQYQKSFDQVSWIFNHLSFLIMTSKDQANKYSYIGLEIGYDALTDKDIKRSVFDFNSSSKLDNKVNLAMKTLYFAKSVNKTDVEYEILKIAKPLLQKDMSKKNLLEETDERMKEIALSKGVLSFAQIVRLKFETWTNTVFGILILIPLFGYCIDRTYYFYKYGTDSDFPNPSKSLWLGLKETLLILTGVKESKGYLGFFRTLWLFVAAYAASEFISKSVVNLSDIIIRN